ncbi:MAG: hypothetical protein DMF61_14045 [Blastocatellia bacterium AA13]|nr:MAG: hypothetical protein DMF61_14045 [Blastocatellia bacterium AA13]
METLEPLRPEGNRFETTQFYNHTVLTAGLRSALCDTGLIRSKIVHRVPRVFSKKNLIPHRAMVVGCNKMGLLFRLLFDNNYSDVAGLAARICVSR